MAKESQRGTERTPSGVVETTPPSTTPMLDYSFTLQAIMEMQKTLGGLSSDIRHLTDTVKEHDGKIDKLSHKVYAATAIVTVLWAIALAAIEYLKK